VQVASGLISWGCTVESSVAAINGGAANNEDALQRLLAAKRSALMKRLDPDGQFEAAALQMQLQHSPLHHRALSPTKDRALSSPQPSPLQRKLFTRPTSAAASYDEMHVHSDTAVGEGAALYAPPHPQAAAPSSPLLIPSSPSARRLERFAAIDARVSGTIDLMHAHAHAAAASLAEPSLLVTTPALALSRPSSAVSSSRAALAFGEQPSERASRAEAYFVQIQVENSSCGFSDRFDCVIMTHASERRPYVLPFLLCVGVTF
jgi:hypothetical protein